MRIICNIYYNVKEHVVIKNTEGLASVIDSMADVVSSIHLGTAHEHSGFEKLSLTADGKEYSLPEGQLDEIISAIGSAKSIDLAMEYWGINVNFILLDAVTAAIENDPSVAHKLFYSLYNIANSGGLAGGILSAYGEMNGKVYSGVIEPKPVLEFPHGVWTSDDTVVVFDDDVTPDMDPAEVKRCLDGLAKMSTDVDYSQDDLTFYMNELTLKTAEEANEYIKAYRALERATRGKSSELSEFVDFSGKDARMMTIEFGEDGKHNFKLLEV